MILIMNSELFFFFRILINDLYATVNNSIFILSGGDLKNLPRHKDVFKISNLYEMISILSKTNVYILESED